jgi:four helix bundle protein
MSFARNHSELEVYKKAFAASMRVFELSKSFPREERYSMTDQMRRSARSVFANIAEAWRKRRYPKSFALKLNDSEGEAAETQAWLQSAVECKYVDRDLAVELYKEYDEILAILVHMINHADDWKLPDA